MKSISIGELQGKLNQLFEGACRGELIVLTDGIRRIEDIVARCIEGLTEKQYCAAL